MAPEGAEQSIPLPGEDGERSGEGSAGRSSAQASHTIILVAASSSRAMDQRHWTSPV